MRIFLEAAAVKNITKVNILLLLLIFLADEKKEKKYKNSRHHCCVGNIFFKLTVLSTSFSYYSG